MSESMSTGPENESGRKREPHPPCSVLVELRGLEPLTLTLPV
jgi:hypothetical protein